MDLTRFYSLNFLGRLLLSAVLINAILGKITNFAAQAEYLTSKGFPEPVSMIMMVGAIALLLGGTYCPFDLHRTEQTRLFTTFNFLGASHNNFSFDTISTGTSRKKPIFNWKSIVAIEKLK